MNSDPLGTSAHARLHLGGEACILVFVTAHKLEKHNLSPEL